MQLHAMIETRASEATPIISAVLATEFFKYLPLDISWFFSVDESIEKFAKYER